MATNICLRAFSGLKNVGPILKPSRFVGPSAAVQIQVRNQMNGSIFQSLFGYKFVHKFDEKSRIYVVDGNLAVGKTTLAKELADRTGLKYFPEATINYLDESMHGEKLEDERFNGFVSLKRFYEDPLAEDGHSFRLQFVMYLNRYLQFADVLQHLLETGQGVVMERSVYSDFVFLDAILEMGWAKDRCLRYYKNLADVSLWKLRLPHCIIYLDAPCETLHQRFIERGEGAEKDVPLEYFHHLENAYIHKFLPQMSQEGVEVLHYDWTKFGDPDKIIADMEKLTFEDSEWDKEDNVTLDVLYRYVRDKFKVMNSLMVPDLLPELTVSSQQYQEIIADMQKDFLYTKGYNKGEKSLIDLLVKG